MRRTAPRRIAEALAATLEDARPASPLAAVQQAWREAAGERIAAEAEPASLRDGTLTVACRSAVWAQELELLSGELLERLADALGEAPGGPRVTALRVTSAAPR